MMNTRLMAIIAVVILPFGCQSKKTVSGGGDDRTVAVKMLNQNTYLLNVKSNDSTYAFTMENPVKVGGAKASAGPQNERYYLNALLGPDGELTRYNRVGSCCPFSTPNGLFQNSGMLDKYQLTYAGGKDTFFIYINMYDKGNLYIPIGLTARK